MNYLCHNIKKQLIKLTTIKKTVVLGGCGLLVLGVFPTRKPKIPKQTKKAATEVTALFQCLDKP